MNVPVRWSLEGVPFDAYEVKNANSSSLHGHHHFLITLVTRGEGVQTLNGTDVPFGEGDLFMLSPADFHKNTVKDGESYDYFGIKFPYELIDPQLFELCGLDKFPIHLTLSEKARARIQSIFEILTEECSHRDTGLAGEHLARALLEEMFIHALREMPAQGAKPTVTFVNRVLGFLYSRFLDDIDVACAANFVNYTPNYFNAIFHKTFGMPFGAYLKNMRLGYAKNLLLSCDNSLTEIAFEAGFGSLSYFSRSFKAAFGLSPQEYRKRHKDN